MESSGKTMTLEGIVGKGKIPAPCNQKLISGVKTKLQVLKLLGHKSSKTKRTLQQQKPLDSFLAGGETLL